MLILSSNLAFGQYLENYEKKALAAFHSKDYSSALLFSEKVLEIDTTNIASMFIAGEAARLSGDLQKAEAYLESIPEAAKVGYYAVSDFQLATVKLDLDKRAEAKHYYQKYIDKHNESNNLFAYLAIEALKTLEDDKGKNIASNMRRMPENVNTAGPEYAPLRYADKMYFTSMVKVVEVDNKRKKKTRQVSRIFEARGNYPALEFAGNPEKESLNSGNISLTPDASTIYYTLCKGDFSDANGCEIWCREREYEGNWGPPKRLPAQVNLKGYNATQPSIAWDKIKKQYVIYFVSDRPNGYGGLDIWCSAIGRDGSFSEPVCLPFNTPDDDITPFFHQATQTLFFSSNGWPGKGGFDIFREKRTETGEWNVPENLGDLLNSSYDDTYYSFHSQSQNAYLVSNRPSPYCNEQLGDTACLDIYEVRVFVELEMKMFRSLDNAPVYAPQVDIREVNSDEVGSFASRKDDNMVSIRLETGKRYQLTVTANGFEPYSFEFSTEEISYFIKLNRQIYLKRPLDP